MTHPSLQDRVTRLDCAVHHGSLRAADPTMIVMHCTEGGSARSSIEYLNTTADKDASYHYLIDRDGSILRMTAPNIIAWHAGDSAWPNPIAATSDNPDKPNGGRSVNWCSLGIAWANDGEALTPEQIESALWLCSTEMAQYGIPAIMVVGHYEVSPGRKTDPRPAMDMGDWRAQLLAYGAP